MLRADLQRLPVTLLALARQPHQFGNQRPLGQVAPEASGQVLLRYCDAQGAITPESNPNGSVRNIACICNEQRTVFGMMPHPERACAPQLGNTDGQGIFQLLFSAVPELSTF